MNARMAALCALVLLSAAPAAAHRLDEYLQAATIAVERGGVRVDVRLAPGVEVFPAVFAQIDRDGNGIISSVERQAYAERVLREVSLTVGGTQLPLRLVSWTFAPPELLELGRGEIHLAFDANVPDLPSNRTLTFENRHQRRISSYLVNAIVPQDADIKLGAQRRNHSQSSYELEYTDMRALTVRRVKGELRTR